MRFSQQVIATTSKILKISALVALFSLNSMSWAQSGQTTASKSSSVASKESATRGLLFEIKSGDKTAYLFGSIHIAKADFYPMSPKVEKAYQFADTVAIEADTTDVAAAQAIMPKLMYVAPDKLENHLTPTTWSNFQGVFGPGSAQMQTLKPFMITSAIAVQVGMQMGFDPAQGIDMHFIQRAKTDKKSLVELESLGFQADIVSNLTDEESDSLISSLLESIKKREMAKELEGIVASWKAADTEALAKLFTDSANKDPASKRLMKMLMDDRNEGMAAKIQSMMAAGKKLMVVIGAGHLAGEKSVVDLLRKQGMTVTQIR
ncbi:TraB/GumN family protein [Undibacterium sp. Ji22W]|uniref:TraB/GumN family protein n=1 Tax=Undibacterium sp. Ji22W TaxID=3413038 RepID=UPI003BF1ACE0